jgi:hypothetical protein
VLQAANSHLQQKQRVTNQYKSLHATRAQHGASRFVRMDLGAVCFTNQRLAERCGIGDTAHLDELLPIKTSSATRPKPAQGDPRLGARKTRLGAVF